MAGGVGGRTEGTSKRTERLLVPDALARAAAAHQRCRQQLNVLRRQRVSMTSAPASAHTSSRRGAAALVLIHESRMARDSLREEVGHLVSYLEGTGAPLRRIIDHVRGMIDALHASGALVDDDGAMADEIAHWIIDSARARRPSHKAARTEARVLPIETALRARGRRNSTERRQRGQPQHP